MVQSAKRARVRAAGWHTGSVAELLGLSPEESALIEIHLERARGLKRARLAQRLSQSTFAARIGSSQSRVAKMEAGDPSVSLDLLVRAHLALGETPRKIAATIARAVSPQAHREPGAQSQPRKKARAS